MALTKEDLLAIKGIVDESVKDLKTDVKGLKTDVEVLKTDVKDLRTDVEGLKTDVKDLRTDVEGLRTDVEGLKTHVESLETNVEDLKTHVEGLEEDMTDLKDRVKKIEVIQLENYLIPKVDEIAAYQKSVYERYSKGADTFEKKIPVIDSLEKTVADHSRQIQELQEKMA